MRKGDILMNLSTKILIGLGLGIIAGLELGADDYVVKPFDAKEVVARVKAVLRRTQGKNGNAEESKKVVTYDKLEINIANYELKVNGVQIDTPTPAPSDTPAPGATPAPGLLPA